MPRFTGCPGDPQLPWSLMTAPTANRTQNLRTTQLDEPFTARMTKGPVTQGQACRVVSFVLFDNREACDICGAAEKPNKQVTIEVDGQVWRSGLDCLHDISGFTAKRVENAASDQLSIALSINRVVGGSFADVTAALSTLAANATTILAGTHDGPSILAEIMQLQAQVAASVPSPATARRVREIADHLALLRSAHHNPQCM